MKLAFCLFKYFPFGGLQRDCLQIAQAAVERHHDVHLYTTQWQGERPNWLTLHLIQKQGWQNHTRLQYFSQQVKDALDQHQPDLVIGFNKMPYLDIYYAADSCYAVQLADQPHWWHQVLPRYRLLRRYEHAVFAQGQSTHILLLAPDAQALFTKYYHTESHRFSLLPPGIRQSATAADTTVKQHIRQQFNKQYVLLFIGSNFHLKGLQRVLLGLAALPPALQQDCQLLVIGQDRVAPFHALARRLRVDQYIQFLGPRHNVSDYLLVADLLLHPAYRENTGTVLLEALVAGVPVLTTAVCGYAHYITTANAGMVLATPFMQQQFNQALHIMLCSAHKRQQWRQNGLAFAHQTDLYSLAEKALTIIETIGSQRYAASD